MPIAVSRKAKAEKADKKLLIKLFVAIAFESLITSTIGLRLAIGCEGSAATTASWTPFLSSGTLVLITQAVGNQFCTLFVKTAGTSRCVRYVTVRSQLS